MHGRDRIEVRWLRGRDSANKHVFSFPPGPDDWPAGKTLDWDVQGGLGLRVLRYLQHARVEPTVNGSTYSWEMRDLPPIEPEVMSPPVTSLAPWLAVTYQPAANAKSGTGRAFASWADVSRWMTELSDPQMVLDDNLAGKAKQLTANAKTEYERIQAIGRFVQSVSLLNRRDASIARHLSAPRSSSYRFLFHSMPRQRDEHVFQCWLHLFHLRLRKACAHQRRAQ